uniref:Spaetzle domain-containing protein n=1 Tax=Anopheles dirus TaxID=7168 RepID=A0A182NEA1_9DIPT
MLLLLVLPLLSIAESYGYDSASSCDPTRASRRGRSQLLKTIPCDLSVQAYCNLPGSAYPWHAVRRFVHENQGLMRRMYGDVRHISVLKEEFENNEIDIDDIDRATERYTRQSSGGAVAGRENKRMKYLRPSMPHFESVSAHLLRDKNNEIPLNEPHFRPTQIKTTATTTVAPTTSNITSSISSTTSGITASPFTSSLMSGNSTPTMNETSTTTSTTVELPPPKKDASLSAEHDMIMSTTLSTPEQQQTDPTIVNRENEQHAATSTTSTVASSTDTSKGIDETFAKTNGTIKITTATSSDTESIDMDALSTLAKLGTGEVLLMGLGSTEKPIEEKGDKISSTLKLVSSSGTILVAATDSKDAPVTEAGSKAEEIESTINTYSNDREDIDVSVAPETDDAVGEDSEPSANSKTVAEPLVHHDTASASSNIHPQKIRFESIKPHPGAITVNGGTTPAKKPSAEGQLFQDTAQKEPTIINGRGVNACPVKEEVVAPFWANNTRGEVLALLNLYPFEQYVHWEKCTHELKQMYCREGCRCEQQYRLHRLLAYDPHNECRGIFSDWFRFPSCCICKCYDMPFDFRVTSRSPRSLTKESIELVEDELQNAIYEHAVDEWYRPKENDHLHVVCRFCNLECCMLRRRSTHVGTIKLQNLIADEQPGLIGDRILLYAVHKNSVRITSDERNAQVGCFTSFDVDFTRLLLVHTANRSGNAYGTTNGQDGSILVVIERLML